MTDTRPGLSLARMARLSVEGVERVQLDLSGVRVLTEAASGSYVVTPVLAALAGAEVTAVTRDSRYGTAAEVRELTMTLAARVGVADRITVRTESTPAMFGDADLITNSAHLRPITGEMADAIRPSAALTLMFEAWEIQAGRYDLDLHALRARGVRIAGTNERHPLVDVFSYLGPSAVAALADLGVSAYRGRVAVLCDNTFADHLQDGLKRAGADVRLAATLDGLRDGPAPDALVVAMTPTGRSILADTDLVWIATRWPGAVVCQFWGDVDRAACTREGVGCWPAEAPGAGHMGVLPARVGPEPTVRLMAGGLKVGQVLLVPPDRRTAAELDYLDQLPDQPADQSPDDSQEHQS